MKIVIGKERVGMSAMSAKLGKMFDVPLTNVAYTHSDILKILNKGKE